MFDDKCVMCALNFRLINREDNGINEAAAGMWTNLGWICKYLFTSV